MHNCMTKQLGWDRSLRAVDAGMLARPCRLGDDTSKFCLKIPKPFDVEIATITDLACFLRCCLNSFLVFALVADTDLLTRYSFIQCLACFGCIWLLSKLMSMV